MSALAKISSVLTIFSFALAKMLSVVAILAIFLSTNRFFICGGENIIYVGGKLCILFLLSALVKMSSDLAIFSSVLAKI